MIFYAYYICLFFKRINSPGNYCCSYLCLHLSVDLALSLLTMFLKFQTVIPWSLPSAWSTFLMPPFREGQLVANFLSFRLSENDPILSSFLEAIIFYLTGYTILFDYYFLPVYWSYHSPSSLYCFWGICCHSNLSSFWSRLLLCLCLCLAEAAP